ncbi:MAG: NAD-binding protein [Rhodobacteraceae bacterium]|nr:NAD-binding protein [Paracoccaceae bacterium]
MDFLGSPRRTLGSIVIFLLVVVFVATLAYMAAGWSLADSIYMVLLTVYSVGYGEVHPIDTAYLHAITVATMIFGCTGAILLTGALVQYLTVTQLAQIFGTKRMTREIAQLDRHVIVVGFGRIGETLAKELNAGAAQVVVIERSESRLVEAQQRGLLYVVGDGTDERTLEAAGISRARALATVLPDDAANVFITLSARSLNSEIEIIARAEMPGTERKLLQAGADRVVLPSHIGGERMAEMILFSESARFHYGSKEMQALEHTLRGLGLEMEVVVVPDKGPLTGRSVSEIERRGDGQFFIVQLIRRDGETLSHPSGGEIVRSGDGVVVIGRGSQAARTLIASDD